MEQDFKQRKFFEGVQFVVIADRENDTTTAEQLISTLTTYGGTRIFPQQNDQSLYDLTHVSHMVSSHIDFPQYGDAIDMGVAVVKPSWVFHSVDKQKLASERQYSPDPSQIFTDVVMTPADIPESDANVIAAGVVALGGQYALHLSKLTTHLVSLGDGHPKCEAVRDKSLDCLIVTPHWFDDCFRLGKKLNERPYLLPNPEILRIDAAAPSRDVASPDIEGAVEVNPSGALGNEASVPASIRQELNVLVNKKIMFSDDLNLPNRYLNTLSDIIVRGGGALTRNIDEAHIFVCMYREGENYLRASCAKKVVASLSWLYHVINHNRYTNPCNKLLHYPIPIKPLPGFENLKISISSYTGDARIYIQNLIQACGAEFTKSMKQDNTHLIAALQGSEKTEAAAEWDIHVANHLWLEESYAKCAPQKLDNTRYKHFPTCSNLSEVVGRTVLDMKRVEQMFFSKSMIASCPAQSTPGPALTSSTTDASLGNNQEVATVNTDKSASPNSEMDCSKKESTRPPEPPSKRGRGRPRKTSVSTPRRYDEEKENRSPTVTTTGRASKARALDVMHKQADDIALFQKERKRKGGVVHGGRQPSGENDLSSPAPRPRKGKRSSDQMDLDDADVCSDVSGHDTDKQPTAPSLKKPRKDGSAEVPTVKHRMMVTGYDVWSVNQKRQNADMAALRLLGVEVTTDPTQVSILIAPKILRTRKFVAALAAAPDVVNIKFLDQALKQNQIPKNLKPLKDRETEDRLGLNLSESLDRAKSNEQQLLRGWSIYVTKSISGGFETFEEIIKVNGGGAHLFPGRPATASSPVPSKEHRVHDGQGVEGYMYLLSGDSAQEQKIWSKFFSLAESSNSLARVVKSDWLLDTAMRQEITWNEDWLLDSNYDSD